MSNTVTIATLEAFSEAWSSACTGLDCRGISPGFMNSVIILVPSVVLSILLGAVNGYALAQWRFPGAEKVAAAITVGVFIPIQVVMLPMVKIFAFVGLQGSLVSIIAVHVVFSLPFMALLFRNFFASIPEELTRAALVDGAGFWSIFFWIMLPMSTNVLLVALVLQFTHIWNDYLLGLIFAGRDWKPMTVQLNNIVNSVQGVKEYNVNMAATILTSIVPLALYLLTFILCFDGEGWYKRKWFMIATGFWLAAMGATVVRDGEGTTVTRDPSSPLRGVAASRKRVPPKPRSDGASTRKPAAASSGAAPASLLAAAATSSSDADGDTRTTAAAPTARAAVAI